MQKHIFAYSFISGHSKHLCQFKKKKNCIFLRVGGQPPPPPHPGSPRLPQRKGPLIMQVFFVEIPKSIPSYKIKTVKEYIHIHICTYNIFINLYLRNLLLQYLGLRLYTHRSTLSRSNISLRYTISIYNILIYDFTSTTCIMIYNLDLDLYTALSLITLNLWMNQSLECINK